MNTSAFIIGTPSLAIGFAILGDAIDATTHIPIGTAVGIAGVVLPACWYLASKFRSIDDQLASIEKHIKSLPCEGKGCNRKHEDE